MKDRLIGGFAAGAIGGVAANAWSFFAGWADLSTLRYVDWTAIALYGHTMPFTSGEIAWALVIQLGLCAGSGVIFSYLLLLITSQNLYFRGWLFSCAVWLMIYVVSLLFRFEGTVPSPLKTVISHFIGASIYGLVLSLSLKALLPSVTEFSRDYARTNRPQHAAKRLDSEEEDDPGL